MRTLDYAPTGRRFSGITTKIVILLGILCILIAFVVASVPLRTVRYEMDVVTGSQRLTTSTFWTPARTTVRPSALDTLMRSKGESWTPQWSFHHQKSIDTSGSTTWSCGRAPAIYQLAGHLDTFIEEVGEAEAIALARNLEGATQDERESLVSDAIEDMMADW